ncbi:MAG: DUF488 domain-containing protein [Candidatus Edwardsbacteria bacterium]
MIYSLGTGTRTIDEFIRIIKDKRIEAIVDVRRFPTSRFEQFKKGNFSKTCVEQKIEYLYLGDELGGYRKGGYEAHARTNEFQSGIERLKALADKKTICIVCAETLPWKCHRRFIAQTLSTQGYEVVHILDKKHILPPRNLNKATEFHRNIQKNRNS